MSVSVAVQSDHSLTWSWIGIPTGVNHFELFMAFIEIDGYRLHINIKWRQTTTKDVDDLATWNWKETEKRSKRRQEVLEVMFWSFFVLSRDCWTKLGHPLPSWASSTHKLIMFRQTEWKALIEGGQEFCESLVGNFKVEAGWNNANWEGWLLIDIQSSALMRLGW